MAEDTPLTKTGVPHIDANENNSHSEFRVRRFHLILDTIKKEGRITKYELSKKTGIAYTTLHRIVREMEFYGAVATAMTIGKNNVANKLIYLPEDIIKKEEQNGE